MLYYDCFAANYTGARGKFLNAARAAKASIKSFTHPNETAPDGMPLAIDVACLGDSSASRQILMLSGTHGVEGFLGSAAQIAWLKSGRSDQLPRDVGVVLVHAVNPFGFAHFTHTTENNVDLNHNFIDHDLDRSASNPDYDTLHKILMMERWTEAEMSRVDAGLSHLSVMHGRDVTFEILARGQYTHPDGLMYGGKELEWPCRIVQTIVQDDLVPAEKVAFLDFHTGGGEWAEPSFYCFSQKKELLQRAGDWWGSDKVDIVLDCAMERDADVGQIFCGVQHLLGDGQMCGAVIEFGTRGADMRRVLLLDHWLRRQRHLPADSMSALQFDILDAFCPVDGRWRVRALESALKLIDQATDGLAAWQ